MLPIIENMVKKDTVMNDEVITSNMLASAKGAADAYFNATMTSSTPELRAVYGANLNQVIGGHSALTELVIKKEWEKPYVEPTEMLSDAYKKSENVINEMD
jgi:spore coat protein CotF